MAPYADVGHVEVKDSTSEIVFWNPLISTGQQVALLVLPPFTKIRHGAQLTIKLYVDMPFLFNPYVDITSKSVVSQVIIEFKGGNDNLL